MTAKPVDCIRCGETVRGRDAYPNGRTKAIPKPKLKDRRKYCWDCYKFIRNPLFGKVNKNG